MRHKGTPIHYALKSPKVGEVVCPKYSYRLGRSKTVVLHTRLGKVLYFLPRQPSFDLVARTIHRHNARRQAGLKAQSIWRAADPTCNMVACRVGCPYNATMPHTALIHDQATRLLRQRDAAVTPARVRVLQLLLASDAAMSHQALQQAAAASGQPFDKVTLYRVLDWLAAQGLAHSIAGHDRVRRFSLAGAHHAHAHFECDTCGRLFCLPGNPAVTPPALPPGFLSQRLDITVRGRCADCAPSSVA